MMKKKKDFKKEKVLIYSHTKINYTQVHFQRINSYRINLFCFVGHLAESEVSSLFLVVFDCFQYSFPVIYQQIYCSIQTFKLVNHSLTRPTSEVPSPGFHLKILGSRVSPKRLGSWVPGLGSHFFGMPIYGRTFLLIQLLGSITDLEGQFSCISIVIQHSKVFNKKINFSPFYYFSFGVLTYGNNIKQLQFKNFDFPDNWSQLQLRFIFSRSKTFINFY